MNLNLFEIYFDKIYALLNRVKILPPIMADFGFTFSNTDLRQLDLVILNISLNTTDKLKQYINIRIKQLIREKWKAAQ